MKNREEVFTLADSLYWSIIDQLDLSKDLSSEFTYAIDDIQDFASRNTNFSKTIILPGNAINNKIFGHTFEFTSSNFYNPSADNVTGSCNCWNRHCLLTACN